MSHPTSKPARTELTRLTQKGLDEVIARHEVFRKNRPGGARANLSNHDLSGLDLSNHDLAHADFTGSTLVGSNFTKSRLDFCLFFGADMRESICDKASMIRADLRGACLRGARMANADLTDADLRDGAYAKYDPEKGLTFASEKEEWKAGSGGVDLRGAKLSSAKLSGAVATNSNFSDANLSKAVFVKGDLTGANLSGANLVGADLSNCELKNVSLRGANLAGAKMDLTNLESVDMTGALSDKAAGPTIEEMDVPIEQLLAMHKLWLESKGAAGKRLDLTGYDLRSMKMARRVDLTMFIADKTVWYEQDFTKAVMAVGRFREADMRSCLFIDADCRGGDFTGANMARCRFAKARLEPLLVRDTQTLKSNFSKAILRHADFTGADLREANFMAADLSFADFTNANIKGAVFTAAVMDSTKINQDK